MTLRSRPARTGIALSIGALCAVVLAGCTEGSKNSGSPAEKPPPTSSSSKLPSKPDEKLGKQAEAALDTVTIDDPEFVESGLETLSDGVHAESLLTRGKSYQLGVSCAGSGTAELSVHIKGKPVVRRIECDGTATYERITEASIRLGIDVEGEPGASGMVAWRISEM
ncbi:hypothetical protein RCO28_30960 [Streptomyces sp. LHD-70]|uniref:hypothetical protein n=1 Tax=Streptomyces sp. LHD-70 TaxID=3072140 RepID=UPI00280CB9E1|nr:hypothetical protein [Streptomyces sp. LHD-70]MDQ8706858.1 hypothetical protein [Streptomyces sp. LHD-70]